MFCGVLAILLTKLTGQRLKCEEPEGLKKRSFCGLGRNLEDAMSFIELRADSQPLSGTLFLLFPPTD